MARLLGAFGASTATGGCGPARDQLCCRAVPRGSLCMLRCPVAAVPAKPQGEPRVGQRCCVCEVAVAAWGFLVALLLWDPRSPGPAGCVAVLQEGLFLMDVHHWYLCPGGLGVPL